MYSRKLITASLFLMLIIGGYIVIKRTANPFYGPYEVKLVQYGDISETVGNTGQVEAKKETVLKSSVNGTVTSIPVSVGKHVNKGELLLKVDSKLANLDLQNAEISYQKASEPAKPEDISTANGNLNKAYDDAFAAVSNANGDLPYIIPGLKDLLYSRTGYLSDQQTVSLDPTARGFVMDAGQNFDKAYSLFQKYYDKNKNVGRTSATSSLDAYFDESFETIRAFADALKRAQAAVVFISTNDPNYDPNDASTAQHNVTTWSSQVNTDLANISAAKNAILTAVNALKSLEASPDALNLAAQKNVIAQKKQALNEYSIYAPYDGIVGKISVNTHDQIAADDPVITIYDPALLVVASLNEVDAAKIKKGQKVTITFDALNDVTASGTVKEIDQVGTVSQGIVFYNVKSSIDSKNAEIKPGMSANLSITTVKKENVLTVPNSALKKINDQNFVFVLPATSTMPFNNSTSTVMSRIQPISKKVEMGISNNLDTEIIAGLNPNDMIVIKKVNPNPSPSQSISL